MEFVCVPIGCKQYAELAGFLEANNDARSPSDVVSYAIDYWLDNASWKRDSLLKVKSNEKGYRWKQVFLPHGTNLRMKYRGTYHYSVVSGDHLIYDDKPVSPSEFTSEVTGTSRNAWRDIEIKYPDGSTWILADELRKLQATEISDEIGKHQDYSIKSVSLPSAIDLEDEQQIAWWEVTHLALTELGGEGELQQIYRTVGQICDRIGKSQPRQIEATIRGTLEDNSSQSDRYKGVRDVFTMPRGKGAGYWGLK